MSALYSIETELRFTLIESFDAEEHWVTLRLTFCINPGRAHSSIEPGEPASVHVTKAEIGNGDKWEPAPDWLWPFIEGDEALDAEMVAEAFEAEQSARDDHADMIREERLLERRA